ncbi:MAG: F0F1 ATP synthase subunit A [Deltaproteobacteria bacterium]|nr:F0F1 ATP synthase subunit A [Deltaproteobacteria bacterium]
MSIKDITPDQVVFWEWGFAHVNLTLLWTWGVMLLMVIGSWLVTRNLSTDVKISRWQNLLEILVMGIRNQIRDMSHQDPDRYMAFIGTLFLFLLTANLLTLFPVYVAPTASLSTTAALAVCVFVAVPVYGIKSQGLTSYLKQYVQPTMIMLPFNIMGELSRTLALAVRLFGNIMSTDKIIAIFLALAPLFFPILMRALGLLTGVIQAYIFAVLAMVYIASATRAHVQEAEEQKPESKEKGQA